MSTRPSDFGRMNLTDSDQTSINQSLETLMSSVKTLETSPKKNKATGRLPEVVNRLIDKDSKYYKRRRTIPTGHQANSKRKIPQVREVKKAVSVLDNEPGAAHYSPKFASILPKSPAISLKDKNSTSKLDKSNVDECSMSEMIVAWSDHIRNVDFTKAEKSSNSLDYAPLPPSTVEGANVYKFSQDARYANRDSYIIGEKTPGPSAYNTTKNTKKNHATLFHLQVSRFNDMDKLEKPIRDTRSAMDAIRKREPQQISFDKQAPREKRVKEEDPLWQEIENEQREILKNLITQEKAKKAVKKQKTADFAKQTRDNRSPFAHIMRKETDVVYDVESSLKYLDRPTTSFDIGQKAYKFKREILNKTEAPDIMYFDSHEQWKKTKPRDQVSDFNKLHYRKDPYYYMPKPCGEEDKRSKEEIYRDEEFMREREMTSTRRQPPSEPPERLKRIIDTPLQLQRNKSAFEHRYEDVFK